MRNFFTRNAVIPCETGVFANARDGHRLTYNSKTLQWQLYDGVKSKHVKKHTLKPHYISNRYIDSNQLYFEVYRATDVTKKGLLWNKVYEAVFFPNSDSYTEKGSNNLAYWVNGEGNKLIDNSIVDVLNDDECIKKCFKYLWNFSTVETLSLISQIKSLSDFIMWWIGKENIIFRNTNFFKNRAFGVEIEFTGTTRYKAAKAIAEELNSTVERHSTRRVNYKIQDSKGRFWKVIYDASIDGVNANGNTTSEAYRCELVTPICNYDDIETIQRIVRKLRGIGMQVNTSTGIHIHVDFDKSNASGIRNLLNLMGYCENVLYSQLNVPINRQNRWCSCTSKNLVVYLNGIEKINSNLIMDRWYNGVPQRVNVHYDSSRYTALNLHSLWQGKGVEFRMFNSTTHAGKIKAYIQFCLALSEFACGNVGLFLTNSYHKATFEEFAELCKIIGLTGDEFKTARIHLINEDKEEGKVKKVA